MCQQFKCACDINSTRYDTPPATSLPVVRAAVAEAVSDFLVRSLLWYIFTAKCVCRQTTRVNPLYCTTAHPVKTSFFCHSHPLARNYFGCSSLSPVLRPCCGRSLTGLIIAKRGNNDVKRLVANHSSVHKSLRAATDQFSDCMPCMAP